MLAILISWITISVLTFSFGDMLVRLFYRICKKEEQYSFMDTGILGICFLSLLLSITSLWLPSNHHILLAFLLFSVGYWAFRKERLNHYMSLLKEVLRVFSLANWCVIVLSLVALLVYVSWVSASYDPTYYHYQNIRWNEEFPVVFGLGNIEDRFGFNSNYLLLSSLFTFRFLFGEPVYGLISVVLAWFICWLFYELVKSNYDLKRIILLVLFLLFFLTNNLPINESIADTSTDAIPNIFIFYLMARLVLYPDRFNDSFLLFIIVPISLFTYKVSFAPVSLIGLYAVILLIREKDYKSVSFVSLLSFLILAFWCVRNVIISGYLIYPFYEIDLFSFDWKIPESVALSQREHMVNDAMFVFKVVINLTSLKSLLSSSWFLAMGLVLIFVVYSLVLISPFAILYYRVIKKRPIESVLYIIYLVSVVCVLIWLFSAPSYRFISGILMGVSFLSLILIFSGKDKRYPKVAMIVSLLFSGTLLFLAIKRTHNFYSMFHLAEERAGVRNASSILLLPYNALEQAKARGNYPEFTEYKMNGITIYISSDEIGRAYDKLPGVAKQNAEAKRFQPITTVEPIGTTLKEGFRPKK